MNVLTIKEVGSGVHAVMAGKQIIAYIKPEPHTSEQWSLEAKVPLGHDLAPGRVG